MLSIHYDNVSLSFVQFAQSQSLLDFFLRHAHNRNYETEIRRVECINIESFSSNEQLNSEAIRMDKDYSRINLLGRSSHLRVAYYARYGYQSASIKKC